MSQNELAEQGPHPTASEAVEIDGAGLTLAGHAMDQGMSEVFALIEQAAAEGEPSGDSASIGLNPEQNDEIFALLDQAAINSHPPVETAPVPADGPPTSDPPATTEHSFVPSQGPAYNDNLDDFDFDAFLDQTAPPQALSSQFDDVFNDHVFNDLDVAEYIQQHAIPAVNHPPPNLVGAEPSNLPASQAVNPGPLPAFHDIASFVPVTGAYISGTLVNDSAETAAQTEAPAVEEAGEEEVESMPVGDAGDALPSAPGIFGNSTNTPPLAAAVPTPTAVDIPVDILQHHNPQQSNLPLGTMFEFWRSISGQNISGYPPISNLADFRSTRGAKRPLKITPEHMHQEKCDFQGIHWPRYQVTKAQARQVRRMTYKNFLNMDQRSPNLHQRSEDWGTRRFAKTFRAHTNISNLPQTESFFNFRETNTRYVPLWRHYQLRHNVFATGQNAVYHHTGGGRDFDLSSRTWSVQCYNPQSGTSSTVMAPKQCARSEDLFTPPLTQISSLSASHDVLVVGSLIGVYGFRSLLTSPHDKCTTGTIPSTSTHPNHHPDYTDNSTNHVHTFLPRRSSHPVAVFNSNDNYVNTLDIATNTFITSHRFASPVNCSVTSPCARLRLLVSDDAVPVVADVESGAVLSRLPGHTDHGFACAWAPDGITMATGHQDGILQIWDARNLSTAVARIAAEQSGIRALQFSPLGGGKPVLVAAEQADFVHVIDADTFSQKQVIEYFGELAGVSITPDGNTLFVGNADADFGGLMEFSRSLSPSGVDSFSLARQRTRLNRDDLNDYIDTIHADELNCPSRPPLDDRPVPKTFPPPYKARGKGDLVREDALKQKREEKMQSWRQRQGDWFSEEEIAERLGRPDWRHAASRDLRGLGVEGLVF